MVYGPHLIANSKDLRRYTVDLAITEVPVGSTSDTNGYVVADLTEIVKTADIIKPTLVGIKCVQACANLTSVTALTLYLQRDGGNNVAIPSSGAASLAVTAGAVALNLKDVEKVEDVVTKQHQRFDGTGDSLKLVLASTGAATVPGTSTGKLQIIVEFEATKQGLPS